MIVSGLSELLRARLSSRSSGAQLFFASAATEAGDTMAHVPGPVF